MNEIEIRKIHPDHIEESPINPRGEFEEVALHELAQSIAQMGGLIQPIRLRPINGGLFEIIAGHRRVRAWKIARRDFGLKELEIPAIIDNESGDSRAMEMHLVENTQRADLKPHEEAEAVMALMRLEGLDGKPVYPSRKALAERLGKSAGWLADRLKIAELAESVRRDVEKLPVDIARKIARMPVDTQRDLVEGFIEAKEDCEDETDAEVFQSVLEDKGRSVWEEAYFAVDEVVDGSPACTACCHFISGHCLGEYECMDDKNQKVEEFWKGELEANLDELRARFPNAAFEWGNCRAWPCVDLNSSITDNCQSWELREKVLEKKGKKVPLAMAFMNPDSRFVAFVDIDEDSMLVYDAGGEVARKVEPRLGIYISLKDFWKIAPNSAGSSKEHCRYSDWFKVEPLVGKETLALDAQKKKISAARRGLQEARMREIRAAAVMGAKVEPKDLRRAAAQIAYGLAKADLYVNAVKEVYYSLCSAMGVQAEGGVDKPELRHFEEAFERSQAADPGLLLRAAYLPLAFRGVCGNSYNDIEDSAFPLKTYAQMRDDTDKEWDAWEDGQLEKFKEARKAKGGRK